MTFEGVSATSTGCVNAILLADGLASGGRQAAKELLRVYWKRMSDLTSYSIVAPSFVDWMNPTFGLEHVGDERFNSDEIYRLLIIRCENL